MDKMKTILESNQYPSDFYKPIIHNTLEKIFVNKKQEKMKRNNVNVQEKEKVLHTMHIFLSATRHS